MFNLEINEEMFLRRGEHGVRDSDVHPIHSEALQGTARSLYLLGVRPIMIMSRSAVSQARAIVLTRSETDNDHVLQCRESSQGA
jgi:hypothetical protein